MPRFDRTYRILVGPAGKKGIEVLPPFHMTFDVQKDASEKPNPHKIRVWNLAKDTREALEVPDNFCVLYAGYAEEDGALLTAAGNVTFGYSYFDGPDVVTELDILDGYVNIRDTVVSLGYGPGARASAICRDIAKQMGLSVMMADDVPDRTWQNGFSYYGAARAALHKIVAGTGLEWSIQNGQLQIIPRRGVTKRQGFVLSAESGLIGYPERMRAGAREKAKVQDKTTGDDKTIVSAKQQTDGWRATSLLLPTVNPGDMVKLESRTVEGWFRVETVRHTGDFGGPGDWQSELMLVDSAEPPKKKVKA